MSSDEQPRSDDGTRELEARLASLEGTVEDAKKLVTDRAREIADALEAAARPLLEALREELAETSGTSAPAASSRDEDQSEPEENPPEPDQSEPEEDEPEPDQREPNEDEPEPGQDEQEQDRREPQQDEPDPNDDGNDAVNPPATGEAASVGGTELEDDDLDAATDELAEWELPEPPTGTDAGTPGREAPRLVALNMALAGADREAAERRLREEFGVEEPAAYLDEAYGDGGDA